MHSVGSCLWSRAKWLPFATFLVIALFSSFFTQRGFAQDMPYFARNPSGNGSSVVFEFNSRIWLQERGKVARRLTDRNSEEAFPAISPDGQYVAFTGAEGQASEIFLTSLPTGNTVRLTFDGGNDAKVQGWLGKTRLMYSTTIKSRKRGALLFVIDTTTHRAKSVPLVEASEGCVFKGSFVFVKNEKLIDNNRLYRGGYAQTLFKTPADVLDEDVSAVARPGIQAVHLTASYKGISRQPLCGQDRIYFLSDRSGRFNLWSMDADGKNLTQHTFEDTYDIGSIGLSGEGTVLFQRLGDIFSFDPSNGKTAKVEVRLPADAVHNTETITFKTTDATELQVSNDAKRAIMVLRGDLWSVDVDTKKATCLECNAAARIKSVHLDAGGNLFALSDLGGEYKIYRFDLGSGDLLEVRSDIPEPIEDISVSPNGAVIVATTISGKLFLVEPQGGRTTLLDVVSKTTPRWLSWAPDSRHLGLITYTAQDIGRVSMVDVTCNTISHVTSGRYESYFPVFSEDGSKLYFISETNFRSTVTDPWAPRNYWPDYQNRGLIYSIDLRRTHSPTKADAASTPAPNCAAKETAGVATLRDYQLATEEMPIVAANYAMLFAVGDRPYAVAKKAVRDERGKLVDFPQLSQGRRQTPRNLFDEDIFKIEWSADKHSLIAIGRSGLFVATVPADGGMPQKTDLSNIENLAVRVDRSVERVQMFNEMWRLYRDYFWDPKMNGSDWEGARRKYIGLLPRTSNRSEFNEVASAMVAELGTGHTSMRSPSENPGQQPGVGRLGGSFIDDGEGVRVTEVYDGDLDLKEDRSPLSLTNPAIGPGDRITHVIGIAVDDQSSIDKLLDGREGQSLPVTVRKADGRVVQITVKTISANEEAFLRYRHWTASNQETVDRLSGGKVGYFHLYSSYEGDMATIVQQYPSIQDRKGIIIDLRGNNGGNIDAWILNFLQRKTWMYLNGRSDPVLFKNPRDSFDGRFAVLIDGDTYSNGELIAEGARRLGLAVLIGTRTSGAGIWVNSSRTLVDGGPVRIPESGSYVKENGVARWLIEGEGVKPDIQVENDPYLFYHGEDKQLEAAVEYLMR
ncbi:S41 family peptidase [Mesorhizobium sp. NPDC059025]|uniref:S41 family peptidase n=1 Tax=unclassified Mesorhizobium TaxID=325217 RepID=UPI0036CA92E0